MKGVAPGDVEGRKTEFTGLVHVLLDRIGVRPSEELDEAIRRSKQVRRRAAAASITFDPGRAPFRRQVLIIRDPSVEVVTIPRIP